MGMNYKLLANGVGKAMASLTKFATTLAILSLVWGVGGEGW